MLSTDFTVLFLFFSTKVNSYFQFHFLHRFPEDSVVRSKCLWNERVLPGLHSRDAGAANSPVASCDWTQVNVGYQTERVESTVYKMHLHRTATSCPVQTPVTPVASVNSRGPTRVLVQRVQWEGTLSLIVTLCELPRWPNGHAEGNEGR